MIYKPQRVYVPGKIIAGLLRWPFESRVHTNKEPLSFYSERFKKWVTVPAGFKCNGATCAPDFGLGWLFHDWLFHHGQFDDGTPVTWSQANKIMIDIMHAEGWPRWVRRVYWRGIKTRFSKNAWTAHRALEK